MNELTQVGQQLYALMAEKKTNQSQLAKRVKVSDQTISNICRGAANPSFGLLKEIAAKYDKKLVITFVDK